MKELKIEIPDGHEIDTERSTFERIVFRPVKSALPKTWKELGKITGYFISSDKVDGLYLGAARHKSLFAEKEQAEAAIALAQLSQLKKAYNGDWVPDWTDVKQKKYVIRPYRGALLEDFCHGLSFFLAFKDAETRDLFLENFRDLIEQAKPLMS